MKFIVTLIALLIERFFDWSHLRRWGWLNTLRSTLVRALSGSSPFLTLTLLILLPVIIVVILQYLLYGVLYGLLSLIFQLLVLLYCFGPQNLWADGFAAINAVTQGDKHVAVDKLKSAFGISELSYSQSLHRQLFYTVLIEGNSRIFAVIFWFVILGPAGAMLYRVVNLATKDPDEGNQQLTQAARTFEMLLDWLPVRVLTFIFALGGHFVQVMECWRKKVLLGPPSNEAMLTECGSAALGIDENNIPEDGSAEKNAIALLDRSFVILLFIIAMKVLII